MPVADRRHAIAVARAVDGIVAESDHDGGGLVERSWPSASESGFESTEERRAAMVAAALMHDSGKNRSGLGTFSRVGATILRPLLHPATIDRLQHGTGAMRRLADYWKHPELGAAALQDAGSHWLVTAWAAEHHKPMDSWTVPVALGRVLRDCDDD